MGHPEGSIRSRGCDRLYTTSGNWDLKLGSAVQLRQAIEDGIVRTLVLPDVYGNPVHITLNKVVLIIEWSADALVVAAEDDDLYPDDEDE